MEDSHSFPDLRLARELAGRVPTPFFLFSAARLRENVARLLRSLSAEWPDVVLRYPAKTNHELAILSILATEGCELLGSHLPELQLGLRAGFAPSALALQRPMLDGEEVLAAMRAGVRRFHVVRPENVPVLERACQRASMRARVSIRLRDQGRRSPLGALARRHGLPDRDVLELAQRLQASRWLTLSGLNFYVGTQRRSPRRHEALLRRAFSLAARIRAELGIEMEELNLGGGIPSTGIHRNGPGTLLRRLADRPPYLTGSDVEAWGRRLSQAFAREAKAAAVPHSLTLTVESGRSIVGDAGILITRVLGHQGRWIFLDAGRAALRESPLLFTRRLVALQERPGPRRFRHLSGPSLNTLDVLDVWRHLPDLRRGDALAICGAGAYSLSRAERYAATTPASYLAEEDGSVQRIRRPESVDDLVAPMEANDRQAARRQSAG